VRDAGDWGGEVFPAKGDVTNDGLVKRRPVAIKKRPATVRMLVKYCIPIGVTLIVRDNVRRVVRILYAIPLLIDCICGFVLPSSVRPGVITDVIRPLALAETKEVITLINYLVRARELDETILTFEIARNIDAWPPIE
jgi:hypothetical protein